jgi:hypothetical protein
LQTPYCLLFHAERRDLQVYHLEDDCYVQMEPDGRGRIQVPELDLEIGLKDGWVRFWYDGELLPLPAELDERLERLSKENAKQARTIRKQTKELAQLNVWLRQLVEQKAAKAKRRDILDALPGAALPQLQRWIDELD